MADLRTKPRGTAGPKSVLLLLAAASFALAACGGGSSGGGPVDAVSEDAVLEETVPEDTVPEDTVPVVRDPGLRAGGSFAAAIATPIAGSVTQSSDRTGAGATANPVTVAIREAGGMLTPVIDGRNWEFQGQTVDDDDRSVVTIDRSEPDPWQVMTVTRKYNDGSARTVRVLTDAAPADFAQDDFSDYLVLGSWRRVPAKWIDEEGNLDGPFDVDPDDIHKAIEAGVFANGGDPFDQDQIRPQVSTATYNGDAVVKYVDTDDGTDADLHAYVTLYADFGTGADLGTVSGHLDGFRLTHSGRVASHEPDRGDISRLNVGYLMLGSADIGESHSGFFTGDATVTLGEGPNAEILAGKWGGQFYGNSGEPLPEPPNAPEPPDAVAGTFGVTGGHVAILGAYGARRGP